MARRSPPIRCHCEGKCPGRGDQAAYARHADVEQRTVGRWLERGKLPPAAADGLVDFAASDRARGQTIGSAPSWAAQDGDAGAGGCEPFALAQARNEAAKADLNELKAAERRGELVAVEDVQMHWFRSLRTLRTRIEAVPNRVADALVAAARDSEDLHAAQHAVRSRLEAALNEALGEVADAIGTTGPGEDE